MNHELTSMTNTIMTLKIRLGKPLYDIGLGLRYILPSSSWKLHCNETWPSFQPVGGISALHSSYSSRYHHRRRSFFSKVWIHELAPQLWKHCRSPRISREPRSFVVDAGNTSHRPSSVFRRSPFRHYDFLNIIYCMCCIKSYTNYRIVWYKCVYSK